MAAAIAGIICYYVGAMVDFWALTLIDASIERVLLFSYPAIVVLIGSIQTRRAPQTRVVFALLLTYAGIFLAMEKPAICEAQAAASATSSTAKVNNSRT